MTQTKEVKDIFTKGKIQDVVVYPLKKFVDERGWLCELFRHDEIAEEFYPAMAYLSVTEPNVQRGPHEHVDQADLFCFIGTGNFKLRLWDNRETSPTYQKRDDDVCRRGQSASGDYSERRCSRLQKRQHDGKRCCHKLSESSVYGRRKKGRN